MKKLNCKQEASTCKQKSHIQKKVKNTGSRRKILEKLYFWAFVFIFEFISRNFGSGPGEEFPCQPTPPKFRGWQFHPLNLGGGPLKTLQNKGLRTLHPQHLGGKMAPPKFRGLWAYKVFGFFWGISRFREGAHREKLTVRKLINNEKYFFHRLCPLWTVKNWRKPRKIGTKPWKNRHQKSTIFSPLVTPDVPQSEVTATNFYDSGGSLGEELGEELGEIFWAFSCFICCAEWPTDLLPKFLPIYHSMSCGWNLKISSPRASGVWVFSPLAFHRLRLLEGCGFPDPCSWSGVSQLY